MDILKQIFSAQTAPLDSETWCNNLIWYLWHILIDFLFFFQSVPGDTYRINMWSLTHCWHSLFLFWFLTPVLFKVYCCDHTYTTIRAAVATSVREVIGAVADKLGSAEDLLLVSLSSAGGEISGSYMLTKMAQGEPKHGVILINPRLI